MAKQGVLVAIVALALILTGCGGGSTKQLAAITPSNSPTPSSGFGSSAQSVQVVLDAPKSGTVSNPLTVNANASSPNGIKGWVVYVDDGVAFQADNFANSLSTTVSLAAGNHIVYVRAWDQVTNAFGTSPTLQLNVQGAQASVGTAAAGSGQSTPPAPASAPAPAPPAPRGPLPDVPGDAKVFDGIQKMEGWESCSECAGGDATTGNFWTSGWEDSPSMSGSSREFFIGGPPWASALWIKKLGAQNWASHFLWDFWVRFDGTSAAETWTAEYDLWQSIGGREFMIGSHCSFGENRWDIWDSANWRWVPTEIPCPRFEPDQWHHIQWYFERWDSRYHYGVLVVDGKAYTLDRTFDSNPIDWSDGLGVQWQLDQSGSGAPLHEWIDNAKLSIW